jgi:hypothetical protein
VSCRWTTSAGMAADLDLCVIVTTEEPESPLGGGLLVVATVVARLHTYDEPLERDLGTYTAIVALWPLSPYSLEPSHPLDRDHGCWGQELLGAHAAARPSFHPSQRCASSPARQEPAGCYPEGGGRWSLPRGH